MRLKSRAQAWWIVGDRHHRWSSIVRLLAGPLADEITDVASVNEVIAATPSRRMVVMLVLDKDAFGKLLTQVATVTSWECVPRVFAAGDFSGPERLALHRLGVAATLSDPVELIRLRPLLVRFHGQ